MLWKNAEKELPEANKEVLVLGCFGNKKKKLAVSKFDPCMGWNLYEAGLDKVCYWVYYNGEFPTCDCKEFDYDPIIIPENYDPIIIPEIENN